MKIQNPFVIDNAYKTILLGGTLPAVDLQLLIVTTFSNATF